MTKEQLIKSLSEFTKEELIEAICMRNILDVECQALTIIYYCHEAHLNEEKKAIAKAQRDWKQANQDHIDCLNFISKEYKGIRVFDLPTIVRDKIIELQVNEERCYKHLINLQDKLDDHCKQLLKIR